MTNKIKCQECGLLSVMGTTFARAVKLAGLGAAAAFCSLAGAQAIDDAEDDRQAPVANAEDEIVVIGRSGELTRELWLAEEAVFARFNEINSNDDFDIHCYWRPETGSRIPQRICLSNSWREEDANVAQAYVEQIRGTYGPGAGVYQAQQLYMHRRVIREMRQLLAADEALRQANLRLMDAQLALSGETGFTPDSSLSRQVMPGDAGLPFDAQRLFEVRIGRDPWSHLLAERAFTIADVSGSIRKLEIECDQGGAPLEYQEGLEWTVPDDWSNCTLQVTAKRDTSFRLYEFLASPSQPEP